jgi:hypothetical protein
MTQAELLVAVRARLRDTAGTSSEYLWSDAELIDDYGNEARDRMFNLCRYLVIDSTTSTDTETSPLPLCRITLVAGTYKYAISSKIIEVLDIQLGKQTEPLKLLRRDEIPSVYENWRDLDNGTPEYYCADLETDAIVILPPPSTVDTAYLTVSRLPLTRLDNDATPAPTIGFRSEYHNVLMPGIMSLAYQKNDIQTLNSDKAAYYEGIFLSKCAEVKKALEKRYGGGVAPRCNTRMA